MRALITLSVGLRLVRLILTLLALVVFGPFAFIGALVFAEGGAKLNLLHLALFVVSAGGLAGLLGLSIAAVLPSIVPAEHPEVRVPVLLMLGCGLISAVPVAIVLVAGSVVRGPLELFLSGLLLAGVTLAGLHALREYWRLDVRVPERSAAQEP